MDRPPVPRDAAARLVSPVGYANRELGHPRQPVPPRRNRVRRPAFLASLLVWIQRHIIATLSVALIPAFAATALLASAYKQEQRELAVGWVARGDRALETGAPGDAIDAYRTALTFSREDRTLLLSLARALRLANRDTEARAYLLNLWNDQPGNGPINLELARLAATRGDPATALRYYHGAIEGAWMEGAEAQRRNARLELARFLVSAQALAQARVEVIALEQDMPEDLDRRREVGQLMLASGLQDQALAVYEAILKAAPDDQNALAVAGQIAFEQGEYQTAVRYLTRAVAAGTGSESVHSLLDTARAVLAYDPFGRRMPLRERARRTSRALDVALQRLAACPGESEDPTIVALRAAVEEARPNIRRNLARDADLVESTMDLVFRIERETAGCREATPVDRALTLIGQQQRQRAES
jgi:tetratricopeptide (TPR) repeat protein